MTKVERKTVGAIIKQVGDEGTFEAVIATFGEIDKDGDIVEHGAFGDLPVSVLPAHDRMHVPLGKTKVEERGELAVAVGRFNMEIESARNWHSALKFDLENLSPPVQEWSWLFRPMKDRQDTVDGVSVRRLIKFDLQEVSPVLRGSSVGTETLFAKSEKVATPRHRSATSDAVWDGAANERRLPSPVPVASARKAYAWIDESRVEDGVIPKSAGRFNHHFIGASGSVGAASTRACTTGIAVLNGARGGTTVPRADRKKLHAHLAGHLLDADIEPPELRKEGVEPGVRLVDQIQLATWDAEAVLARIADATGDRQLGREAKAAALEMAKQHGELMAQLRAMAEGMLPEEASVRAAAKFLLSEAARHLS